MDGDKTIGAEFFRKYTLSLDPTTTNGTIGWSYGGNTGTLTATGEQFPEGAVVAITAIPTNSTTHGFSQWFGDHSGTTTPSTITMNGDKTIGAEFFRKYTLSLDPTTTNGTIEWSYDGNTGTLTAAGEQFPEGANVTITATPDLVNYSFLCWFGDHDGYVLPDDITMNADKTIGAIFVQMHLVIVGSPNNGTFEYVTTMTDPVTGDEFVYENYEFTLDNDTYPIYVPHGASLIVTLISEPKGKVEWDDGSITRKSGTEYMRTINADLKVTVFITSDADEASPWPWVLIALLGIVFLLLFLDDYDDEIYGKVRRNGKPVAGATVAYTINGSPRKSVETDGDGDYSISVDIGDDIIITDVSCNGAEVTDDVPLKMHIDKERTNVNFDM
jgi:hypothetical protein